MFGSGFLAPGRDFNCKIDRFGEHFPGFSIDDFDILNIDWSDAEIISLEEQIALFSEDGLFDDFGWIMMELFEGLRGNSATDARGYRLASIPHKILHAE